MDIPYLIKKEGLRRGLSPRTIHTYCSCVKRFLNYTKKDVKKITKKDINDYIDKILDNDAAGNTVNVYLNSIKFLMENILNKRLMYNIKYSKVPKRLPTVLTKEETRKLIKFGNEIHGPEDVMYLNWEAVLYWETLKQDSQVVQSILKEKAQRLRQSNVVSPAK